MSAFTCASDAADALPPGRPAYAFSNLAAAVSSAMDALSSGAKLSTGAGALPFGAMVGRLGSFTMANAPSASCRFSSSMSFAVLSRNALSSTM